MSSIPQNIIQTIGYVPSDEQTNIVAGTRAQHELCFSISSEVEYSYGNMEVAA